MDSYHHIDRITSYESQFDLMNSTDVGTSLTEIAQIIDAYKKESLTQNELCSLNLRTSELFKKIRDETDTLSRDLNTVVDDEATLTETVKQIEMGITGMVKLSAKYCQPKDIYECPSEEAFLKELSISKQIILDTIAEKKAKLNSDINTLLPMTQSLRKSIMTGIEELVDKDNANNKKLCPVCFDREVDTAMVPCGHTCCSGCLLYNQSSNCMQCRSKIRTTVKLFFSM